MNRMPHKETVTQSHVCCQPYRQAAFSVGRTRNMHVLHRDRDACQLPAIDDSARGNPATICMPVVFLCLSLSFAPIFTPARVFHGTATVDMRNYLGHFFAVVRPTPPPIVERSIVMRMSVFVCVSVCVCVFVCPRSYPRNYASDLHQIFGACYLWPCLQCFDTVGWAAGIGIQSRSNRPAPQAG